MRTNPRWRTRLTTRRIAGHHNRKAALMDGLAVMLLMVFTSLMGCIALLLSVPR